MHRTSALAMLVVLGSPLVAWAQTADTLALPASRNFNFSEPNYFLFGFEDFTGQSPVAEGVYANQITFRIAIRYRLFGVSNPTHDSGIHVGYRQNSFWHLWEESAPFFDNDYNPQMFFYYDSRDYSKSLFAPSWRLFVEHESDGRAGPDNRSWNYYGLGVDFGAYDDFLYGGIKGWHAFSIAPQNPDITDFVGRGELTLNIQPLVRQHLTLGDVGLAARMRIAGKPFWTNSELNAFVGAKIISWIPGLSGFSRLNASVMIQRFSGTGENLLTYRERRTVTRIGLATVR